MLRKKATTLSSPSVAENVSYYTVQKMDENVKEISNRKSERHHKASQNCPKTILKYTDWWAVTLCKRHDTELKNHKINKYIISELHMV